jgi:transposase-like protein
MPRIATDAQIKSREDFAALLAQTFDPTEIVQLLSEMGLRYSDLALALGVHPRTIRAWLDQSDPRQADRQRDEIQALKAVVLFMLRRGILKPRQLSLWLVEPNERLEFRRPLALLGEGDISQTLHPLIRAGSPFLRAEPSENAREKDVAAGAVVRDRPGEAPEESSSEERDEADEGFADPAAVAQALRAGL